MVTTTQPKLFYGVNGHMCWAGDSPWLKTYTQEQQLAYLKELNATVYRADVASEFMSRTIMGALKPGGVFHDQGITILPVLNPRSQPNWNLRGTEAQGYQLGFDLAYKVATNLKGVCKYIECGNELDAPDDGGFKCQGNGAQPGDWRQEVWPWYRGVQRGMVEGVYRADPTMKCGVGFGIPMAYTLLKMLREGTEPNGTTGAKPVDWDFTVVHWYKSSGNIEKAGGGKYPVANVLAELQKLGKPIWMTEFGWSGAKDDDTSSAEYLRAALQQYRSLKDKYGLVSIITYALIDKSYGLVREDGKTKRPAFQAYKDFVKANPV